MEFLKPYIKPCLVGLFMGSYFVIVVDAFESERRIAKLEAVIDKMLLFDENMLQKYKKND